MDSGTENKNLIFKPVAYLKLQSKEYNFILMTNEKPPRFTVVVPPEYNISYFFDHIFAAHLVLERGYQPFEIEVQIPFKDIKMTLEELSKKLG